MELSVQSSELIGLILHRYKKQVLLLQHSFTAEVMGQSLF